MMRALVPLFMLAGSIWARSQVMANIHPFQVSWCLWVASSVICGGLFGGVVVDEWHRRHHR